MIETLAHEYSSESTQRELSNEYQHDRVKMVFKNLCILFLWTIVASALEGLIWKLMPSECCGDLWCPLMLPPLIRLISPYSTSPIALSDGGSHNPLPTQWELIIPIHQCCGDLPWWQCRSEDSLLRTSGAPFKRTCLALSYLFTQFEWQLERSWIIRHVSTWPTFLLSFSGILKKVMILVFFPFLLIMNKW